MAVTCRFALVSYHKDIKNPVCKEVTEIKDKKNNKIVDFEPKDENDFDRGQVYYIKKNCVTKDCTRTENHKHYYKIYIMRLESKYIF